MPQHLEETMLVLGVFVLSVAIAKFEVCDYLLVDKNSSKLMLHSAPRQVLFLR